MRERERERLKRKEKERREEEWFYRRPDQAGHEAVERELGGERISAVSSSVREHPERPLEF